VAPLVGHDHRHHRRPPRRQLIDHRDVQSHTRHGQGPGIGVAVMMSWCGMSPAAGFLLQRQTLLHAKRWLLVDDDQRQFRKIDSL